MYKAQKNYYLTKDSARLPKISTFIYLLHIYRSYLLKYKINTFLRFLYLYKRDNSCYILRIEIYSNNFDAFQFPLKFFTYNCLGKRDKYFKTHF